MLVWEEDMVKALRKERESLREENARLAALVQQYHPAYLGLPHVVRERNEARADCVRMSMRAGELGIEVARLEGLILDQYLTMGGTGSTWLAFADEARRIRAQREERCPYCANPIGDGSGGTCTAECHAKGDSCRCAQREEGR